MLDSFEVGQLDEEGTTMKKNIFVLLLMMALGQHAFAHIGSPDVIYEGNAGPYKMQVTIQPPDVVPGIAKILIYFPDQKPGRIVIQPVYYEYGSEGAPEGDVANAVAESPGLYQGELWLMGFGASGLKISVEGAKGFGSTVVPVPAIATATRKMETGMGIFLAILGLVLLLGIVFIIGACIREATILPGLEPNIQRKRQAIIVMTVAGILIVTGLFFANKWWSVVEGSYKNNMYKPISLNSSIHKRAEGNELKLELKNEKWLGRKLSDIVPDHGKLMHTFIISMDRKVFAHLHPLKDDSASFHAWLPNLPLGKYYIFSDVVHVDGIGETLTDTIDINESVSNLKSTDPDDSWATVSLSGAQQALEKDLLVRSEIPSDIKAGKMANLRFTFKNKEGKPAILQPYLGMAGHAVVMKDDGTTFIHLHPMGTISMTAQYALANRVNEKLSLCGPLDSKTAAMYDSMGVVDQPATSMMREKTNTISGNEISFPYVFPNPGKYHIWVQAKISDKILTSVFEVKVN
jgi:hypothetical protein